MSGAPFRNEKVLTPVEGTPYSLWLRPALIDWVVVKEIVSDDTYALSDRDLRGATVVDVGGHVGVFTTFCAHLGARQVFVAEPQPENLELLRANVEPFAKQVTVIPKAVGSTRGEVFIHGESGGAHTSLTPDGRIHEEGLWAGFPAPSYSPVEQIMLADLLTLARQSARDGRVNLLKLDCEGAETDILLGCDHDALKYVDAIVMETHGTRECPWVERSHVGEIIEHLLHTHWITRAAGKPDSLGTLFAERYPL